MSEPISWHVELEVRPGQMDAFRALTDKMVEATRGERGAMIYERFIGGDERAVHVYERYVDCAAAVAHLKAFQTTFGRGFASMIDRKSFTVFGTPTPELRQILDPLGATYFARLAGFSRAGE
jgi:quinol monooxygenase YgiN